jgi:outer membrane lipoprotein-sorting protein
MLSRRYLLLSLLPGLAAVRAAAQPRFILTPADQADISRIEAYLNSLKTLKARFLQVAPGGQISQGTVWLDRPGRMRFQYDPPSPYLLVAARGTLVFNDSQLNQTSNIPLGRTPLGILLAEHVSLSGAVTVTRIQRLPGQIQLSLVRTRSPGDGSLTLVFSDNPLALRSWTIVDPQQKETRVTLSDAETGVTPNPRLFDLPMGFDGGATSGG